MKENKVYCSSSFLMYRTIIDKNNIFSKDIVSYSSSRILKQQLINTSDELYESLKEQVFEISKTKKVALALSGGIDSAILAKFLPENTMTYTFKCVVPGKEVIDETPRAQLYANECKLQNKVIEIYWEDFEKYSSLLMKKKGQPIHSIEVQIYKAALQAKKDGIEVLIFGESADCLYGGLSNVLSRDWNFGEFVDRYSYVLPYKVLKSYEMELEPFKKFLKEDGYVDVHEFYSNVFFEESTASYFNACEAAGIECCLPYANTKMNVPLNYELVRAGKNKYMVRSVFEKLYNNFDVPPKTPMPRPMNEWFENWNGPENDIFYTNCAKNMSGDQKWLIWILNKFLSDIEK